MVGDGWFAVGIDVGDLWDLYGYGLEEDDLWDYRDANGFPHPLQYFASWGLEDWHVLQVKDA